MDNKEYENKYEGTVKVLRIIGWPLLFIGIACIGFGLANTLMTMASFDGTMPRFIFLFFIGAPFMMGGIICLSLGYRRKMGEFVASQAAPVAKDFTNYMIDGTSDSIARTIGKASAEMNKGKGQQIEGVNVNTCAKCGNANAPEAKFCSKCGAPLTKVCPSCGATNDDGAKFCSNCGHKLY